MPVLTRVDLALWVFSRWSLYQQELVLPSLMCIKAGKLLNELYVNSKLSVDTTDGPFTVVITPFPHSER